MPHPIRADRDVMEYGVVIIGAGPSGLSCAIRLKQLNPDISVCVLEKGSEVGAHLMSGAVFEPRALNELIPDWKAKGAPLTVPATADKFMFLTKNRAFSLPTPPQMNNHGNYIISLGTFAKWLAEQAEALGVEIFAGFAAAEVLYDQNGAVIGVATGDVGLEKNGQKSSSFTAGVELHAVQTIFAEGCHGSLTKILIEKFNLRKNSYSQTYALGIKEIWEIPKEKHQEGLTLHTIGWPLDNTTYGGSWLYHGAHNMISIGYVVGLDYQNTYLSPFEEMQRFKTHPAIRSLLEGGRRVSYGARTLVEGGYQSLPKLTFPGGMLIGDTAGFLNVPKIKGNHTAMKSGMLAAEALAKHIKPDLKYGEEIIDYTAKFKSSWLHQELYKVRNIRPGFNKGLFFGLINAAFQTLGGYLLPYTLKNHADYAQTKKAALCPKIPYPKPDGVLTFDRLSSVQLSNTNHAEHQPPHLKLKDPQTPYDVDLEQYDGISQRYCPAAVYEFVEDASGKPKFIINAQNCVHCKTCDIKDPAQNITWTVPEGGGGPNYAGM